MNLEQPKPHPALREAIRASKQYLNRWRVREDLEEVFGDLGSVAIAVIHESSDYGSYGQNYALRDADIEGWEGFLDENNILYAYVAGPYNSLTILAEVERDRERTEGWYLVEDKLVELEGYPVFDEEGYNQKQVEYTQEYLRDQYNRFALDIIPEIAEESFADVVIDGVGELSNSQQNQAADRMHTDQALPDSIILAALRASGYRVSES